MIIDAWYDLSVALADPAVPLNEVLRDWRLCEDRILRSSDSDLWTVATGGGTATRANASR
jgi:hypothetical protein